MRVVAPSQLAREAAEILRPIREHATVIGALAVQLALDGHDVALAPTADIDAGTEPNHVAEIVSHLEAYGLRPSETPGERGFTWVKNDVKVQLARPFHPFPRPPGDRLPENNLIRELGRYRWLVAFEESPARGLFWAATPRAQGGGLRPHQAIGRAGRSRFQRRGAPLSARG